jgi:hypothetical protein
MADNEGRKGLLDTIGRIMQRWEQNKSKKKKKKQGLASKIGEIENMSKIDTRDMLLDTVLKTEGMIGRTDEGALTGLRERYKY